VKIKPLTNQAKYRNSWIELEHSPDSCIHWNN
jgi:hypothetical protein